MTNAHAQPERSLDRLLKFLASDPTNLKLRSECSNLAISTGAFEQADQLTTAGLAQASGDPHMRFDRATYFMSTGRYDEATPLLQSLLTQGHTDPVIQLNTGICLYTQHRYEEALAPLHAAYNAGYKSVDLLRVLISSLHHTDHLNEGAAIAATLSADALDDGALAGVCALLYVDLGQLDFAARFAAVARRMNPRSVDARVVEATLHLSDAKLDQAESEFREILALAPDNGRSLLSLGALALLRRDFQSAKHLLQQATVVMPGSVEALQFLSWTDVFVGELDAAERHLQSALTLDRHASETHGALACVAVLRGHRQEGERHAQVAERLDANSVSAKIARALAARTHSQESAQHMIFDTLTQVSQTRNGIARRFLEKIRKPTASH